MSTKQKTTFGIGVVVLIAMAMCPPWATWCVPIDHKRISTAGCLDG